MSKPFIREIFQMYIYQGDYYFYGWNHWSEFGTLTCFYTDGIERVIKSPAVEWSKLYCARAIIDRNPDVPEEVYDSEMSLVLVDENQRFAIQTTISAMDLFEESDKDIIIGNLEALLSKF